MRVVWIVLLLGLVASLYFGFLPVNHSEAEDALHYMLNIKSDTVELHPNHLYFEPMHRLWLDVLGAFGLNIPTELALQGLTVVFSLGVLALVFDLVARQSGVLAGAVTAAVLSVTFSFWHYSTEADTYIPPLFFALLAFRSIAGAAPLGIGRAVLTGLLIAIATLLHQMYMFLAILIPLVLVLGGLRSMARWRAGFIIGAVAGAVVIAAYAAAYATLDYQGGFLQWARGYSRDGLWTPFSAMSPVKGVVGFGTAILSTNVFFSIPATANALTSLFPNVLLVEETFIADTAISGTDRVLILAAMGLFALSGLMILWFALFRRQDSATGATDGDETDRYLLGAVLVYAVLTTVWEPTNREFWIQVVAFLLIWLGRRTTFDHPRVTLAWCTAALALFVANFLSAIEPYSQKDSDYWYVANQDLLERLEPGDVVISDCGYICTGYLRFYGQATVLAPSDGTLDPLEGATRVVLSSWAMHPMDGLERQLNPERRDQVLTALTDRFGPLPAAEPGPQTLWMATDTGWQKM